MLDRAWLEASFGHLIQLIYCTFFRHFIGSPSEKYGCHEMSPLGYLQRHNFYHQFGFQPLYTLCGDRIREGRILLRFEFVENLFEFLLRESRTHPSRVYQFARIVVGTKQEPSKERLSWTIAGDVSAYYQIQTQLLLDLDPVTTSDARGRYKEACLLAITPSKPFSRAALR